MTTDSRMMDIFRVVRAGRGLNGVVDDGDDVDEIEVDAIVAFDEQKTLSDGGNGDDDDVNGSVDEDLIGDDVDAVDDRMPMIALICI